MLTTNTDFFGGGDSFFLLLLYINPVHVKMNKISFTKKIHKDNKKQVIDNLILLFNDLAKDIRIVFVRMSLSKSYFLYM